MSPRCRSCRPVPDEVCSAADLLGRRWAIPILYASHAGASRFNEFLSAVGRIPPRTLAARLVELERAGLLERSVVHARPPHVEYRLTRRGRELRELLDALEGWAATSRRTA